jgi:spermidine/putrescine transport system permease protein
MTEQSLPRSVPAPVLAEFNYQKIRQDMLVRRVGKFFFYFNPLVAYFFLWAPIIVLVVLSFNNSASVSNWGGFSTRWYITILSGAESSFTKGMLSGLQNTLVVGVASTFISTVIGTMVALSLERGRYPGKDIVDAVLYLPVVIPEITQAVSLAIFFKFLFDLWGGATGRPASYGFASIIIGHVVFSISFVVIVVRARLADMNPRFEEAARDLGANEWQTFWRITFPLILPGVVSGALLAFTLSLDDYIVTFFNNGVGTDTLPLFVYGSIRQKISPEINALSTLMLIASMLLVGFSLTMQNRSASRSY